MKKLLNLLLISLLMILACNSISAAGEHVVVNTSEEVISYEQLNKLEDDLLHIEQDYDISIYVIFDQGIEASDTALTDYARNFAQRYFNSKNNVGLFINSQYYYILAQGSASDVIENNIDSLWDEFLYYAQYAASPADEYLYKAIETFYQSCVKLINGEVYQTSVPGVVVATPYVNDYADLLSDSEELELNKKLLAFKNRYGIDAVIVTTNSTNGMNIRDYADDFYDYNGYGKDGILIVLDMYNREWWFSTKGKGIDYFTDYGLDQIIEDMYDDLRSGNYYGAFSTYAKDVEQFTESAINGNTIDYQPEEIRFGLTNIAVSALIGLFVSLVTMLVLKGQLKSVSRQRLAHNYIVGNSFMLTGASDLFVNRHVTRSRRPEPTRSSGGGGGYSGGSSTHTSSSGSSHGGHGGHF
ncbi:MAG: TPM domain-containing protein [Erysipelotrichaceae bacterium]|nr:TPM domain-containing protein [Erysipelotrichaceae bacterium]